MRKELFRFLILILLALSLLPTTAVAAPPQQGGSKYTVQADDTLSKIAEKEYGNPLAYTAILFYSNQQATDDETINFIEDPNNVEPGWTIYLPTAEEANAYVIGNLPEGLFNESPLLAEQVAAGTLPPVQERLPQNPLIINVVESIGQYGGVLRRAFLGPSDANNYVRVVYDALVRFSPDGSEVVPHVAAGWESNADFTQWTIRLRAGAKWSDGDPFDADDIMFWYEDVLLNTDLTPSVPVWMQNDDGSTALVEKVSDTAVRWTFAEPNTTFLLELANKDGGDRTYAVFLPSHYLKQFHPKYADEAAIQTSLAETGFATWPELFAAKNAPPENPQRPTMAAWIPQTTVADQVLTLVRNPYYIGVDPAGNQLPYIDEVRFTFFSDRQALNLAAVAGEFDFQGRHIDMINYPVLVEGAEQGGYRVITWPTFGGSDAAVTFRFNYEKNPAISDLMRQRDFRIAMSHAINREEIRQSAFLGLGEPRQPVPAPWHPYYPGDQYATQFTEYDPDKANQLLDSLGLTQRDGENFRLLPNGEPLTLELVAVPAFGPWTDVAQLIGRDWQNVGIRTEVEVMERSLFFERGPANELMVSMWNNDTTAFPFSGNPQTDPRDTVNPSWPLYAKWFLTDGAEGLEPIPEFKRLVELREQAKTVGRAGQIEIAQEIYRVWSDNLFQVGTVGLTPMIQGVVVVNQNMRNVPELLANDWPLRTPGNARPEQFYYVQQ
jgi:peptide/nickel transport system substrate-binding protein